MEDANPVDGYMDRLPAERRDWFRELVFFIRKNYLHAREEIMMGAPVFWFGKTYVALADANGRFRFSSSDTEIIESLGLIIPGAVCTRGSVTVPYGKTDALWSFLDATRDIAGRK
jgi:hypothetical protein